MKELTNQQSKVLSCVEVYLNKTGFPPPRAEICKELGFKSPNAAEMHLRALEKKGYISIQSGSSRGISIVKSQQSFEKYSEQMPVIGLVAAGSPTLAEENVEKRIPPHPISSHGVDYYLRVKGDSMIDVGIFDNDLIAVNKDLNIKKGSIVIARIDDEVTVKTLKEFSANKVILRAENPNYKDIVVNPNNVHFDFEGTCVGLIRNIS